MTLRNMGILLVLVARQCPLDAHVIMRSMTRRHGRAVHLVGIELFDVRNPLDIVIGVPDVIQDQGAQGERDEEEQP